MSKITISYQRDFTGHKQSVYCVVPDGVGGFFTAGSDGFIVHWSDVLQADGIVFARVPEAIFSLYYDHEHERILAGGQYGNVYILRKGESPKMVKIHDGSVFWVGKSDHGYLSGSAKGDLVAWNHQGIKIRTLKISNMPLRWAIWQENNLWVTGSEGRLWEVTQNLEIRASHLLGDKSWFKLATTPKWVFAVGRDAKLHRWNHLFLDKSVQDAHWYSVHGLAASPNQSMIATGSMDKSIRFWHTHTLEPLGSVYTDHAHGHKSSVNDLLWLDTETLVSVSDDAQVRCWKITQ